jgi:hypothetical protein
MRWINRFVSITVTDGISDPTNWNSSWSGSAPGWVEIDLGQEQLFDTAILYTQTGYEMMNYDLQYWTGSKWQAIAAVKDNDKIKVISTFEPVKAQKVRVVAFSGSKNQLSIARINELELYNSEKAIGRKGLLETVREASQCKLIMTEKNISQAGQLMLSQYTKFRSMFYMVVNPSTENIAVNLELSGAKDFKIYEPYNGSITQMNGDILNIPGYRALFIEPLY